MALTIYKGEQAVVPAKFIRSGSPVTFVGSVRWVLYNNEDDPVQNGVATAGTPGNYTATFTVPTDYNIGGNNDTSEDMFVEFYGTDTNNQVRSAEIDVLLVDAVDDFIPDGAIYYAGAPVEDALIVPAAPSAATLTVKNAAGGTIVAETAVTYVDTLKVLSANDAPDSHLDTRKVGTNFRVNYAHADLNLVESTQPYNAIYKLTVNGKSMVMYRQFYWINDAILGQLSQLRSLLDKARLVEIDPTVQWYDEDLVAALYTGLHRINSFQPIITSWKFSDLPPPLWYSWQYAAAVAAMESRYLAEGFNSFDFTGMNTQLNYDRKEVLQGKIDSYNSQLDSNLPQAKKTAARTYGSGSPDLTVSKAVGGQPIVKLGLTLNPTNNYRSTMIRGRRRSYGW